MYIRSNKIHKDYVWLGLALICFFIGYREVIFYNRLVYTGDTEVWYALYYFFSEAIYNNTLALWNPYMNGGEPFYQTWGMWRLIDPANVLPILIGKIFNLDIYVLFHLHFFLKVIISTLGSYFLFKYIFQTKNNLHFPIALFIFALFTNIFISELMADAHYATFCWVPYILLFLIRFFDNLKIFDFLLLMYFLSIHIGSATYHSIYGVFLVSVFILVTVLKSPGILKSVVYFFIKNYLMVIFSLIIMLVIISPALLTVIKVTELYPVGRTWDKRELFEQQNKSVFELKGHEISYERPEIKARESHPIERVLLNTRTSTFTHLIPKKYINIIIFFSYGMVLLAIFGLFCAKNKWKIQFVILFILSVVMVAGPHTPVYAYLSSIFFPLTYIRNTVFAYSLVYLFYFYFVGIGLIHLINSFSNNKFILAFAKHTILLFFIVVLYLVADGKHLSLHLETVEKMVPDFNHTAKAYSFVEERDFAIPRAGWYLLEPILYKKDVALSMLARPPSNLSEQELPYYKEWNRLWAESNQPNRYGAVIGFRTFFWTTYYHSIYLLGELDIKRFNALMGVGRDKLFFTKNVFIWDDSETEKMISLLGGDKLQTVLDDAVILHDSLSKEKLDTINQLHLLDALKDFPKNANRLNKPLISYNVLSYNPNHIDLSVHSKTDGVFLYRDGYDDAWQAYINGKETKIYRANLGFKAIYLPKGKHQITFTYNPIFFIILTLLSISLSLLIPILLIVVIVVVPTNQWRCSNRF